MEIDSKSLVYQDMADRHPKRQNAGKGKGNQGRGRGTGRNSGDPRRRQPRQPDPTEGGGNSKKELHQKNERLLTKPGPMFNLTVYQPFKEKNEFMAYLRQRELPPDLEFEIDSFTPSRLSTSISIHFHSNTAYKDFHSWIRQTRKVGFLSHIERVEIARASKEFIENNLQIIEEKSNHIVAVHQEKVLKTKEELSTFCGTEQNKKKAKFIPFLEHERKKMHKNKLEEKISELEAQQREFEKSVTEIKKGFNKLEDRTVTQKEIDQLLLEYDIEYSRLEQALPIYARRTEIVETVLENQVCVLLGETGSGKSTQLTQYLSQSKLAKEGRIVCTQPRKVAAASLAQRVASEMKSTVADVIGYQCGIQTKVSADTKVVYMTDHTLLNECLKDQSLNEYSCIIIDEAHERSIYTDILLGMIKKCLHRRPKLRVIVTSATINPDVFVKYFNGCPVIRVSGRMYPVDIIWNSYSEEDLEDFERKAVEKTLEIHDKEPPGDILLFLTGQLEIERCIETLQWELKERSDHCILPLHGKLQTEEQNKIFKETPHGKRKIVISTNVAETSVTIPGVKYVIDTGLAKEMRYDPDKKVNSLKVVKITKSSADQRKGRAGRTSPGKCFRFYSQEDYNNMTAASVPEILRIHIGHAILKLLQLDVNPIAFDFVEPPPNNSMETAYQQLVMLGAVKDGQITNLGKWIAKLPLDPNLGVLVYNAVQKKIGLEAIIIAASCTVSGNLFYRAGTQEQKDTSDKLKIQFCHSKGDHFTFLNVFKRWHYVEEKEKRQWCLNNSINGRAMRNIRDTVNEIRVILKKEMKIPIKFELKDATSNEETLQKLLFKAFQANLCYFLGHEKAGYHFIDKDQQMIIHPSASFQSLALYPKWVIIEKVLNTSREYAVNITEVNEKDVNEALEKRELEFDIADIKRKHLQPIHKEYVGQQLQRQFVGPRWKHAKDIEKKLKTENKDSVFVVDADRDKGEVAIYAPEDKVDVSTEALKNSLDPIRERIRNETKNIPIFPRCYNVKVSIGPGGEIKDLLSENDFNSVFIYCSKDEFDCDEEMVDWLNQFGQIDEFVKKSPANNNKRYRGEVIFKSSSSAKKAVAATREKTSKLQAKPPFWKIDDPGLFKAKLQWCRRKPQPYGFVQIKNEDTLNTILTLCSMVKVSVGGKPVRISRSREKFDELYVQGINDLVNEDILREGIIETFNVSDEEVGRTFIPRKKIFTTPDILDTNRRRLEQQIGQYVDKEKFRVFLRDPGPHDYEFSGYVTFNDPEEGNEASTKLHNKMTIGDNVVSVIPEVHSRMYVLERVFKRVEKEIRDFCGKARKKDRVTIDIKQNSTGNYILGIDADNVDKMIKTRYDIQILLQGQTLDMEAIPSLRRMFSWDGRSKIDEIMEKTHTLIILNDRNTSISIHGKESDRSLVIEKIKKHINKLVSSRSRVVDLKGEIQPPGLMKRIIQMHGINLQGLKNIARLVSAELDHRKHRIKLLGSEDALEVAMKDIEDITKTLLKADQNNIPSTDPECAVCFSVVCESDLYRLESCGHPYCKECVKLHLDSVLSTKDFPLRCCHESCDMLWAWSDINNMKNSGFCTLQTLINASVSCYVAQNPEKVKYCITPDCQMVYKVCEEGNSRFVCYLCQAVMCSRCHVEYHTGQSCAVYERKRQIDEHGLQEWLDRDRLNRDLCPKCYMGIEKHGGCQHMQCTNCKSHICWLCKAIFESSPECYAHMAENHGTFM